MEQILYRLVLSFRSLLFPLIAAPVIVERSPQQIAVELIGGRRVRFVHDVEPEPVRAMVALLE